MDTWLVEIPIWWPIRVLNIACNMSSVWLKSPEIQEADHTPGWFHWRMLNKEFLRATCQGYRRANTSVISHSHSGGWGCFLLLTIQWCALHVICFCCWHLTIQWCALHLQWRTRSTTVVTNYRLYRRSFAPGMYAGNCCQGGFISYQYNLFPVPTSGLCKCISSPAFASFSHWSLVYQLAMHFDAVSICPVWNYEMNYLWNYYFICQLYIYIYTYIYIYIIIYI